MATPTAVEPNAIEADEANLGFVYYRCPFTGEIAAGDWSGMEEAKKIRQGYEPLHDYGYHDYNAYYVEHPFEPLFQQGGAHEMPVSQVIEHGFHIWPPKVPTCGRQVGRKGHLAHIQRCWRNAKPVHFPQLEGLDISREPVACAFADCSREFATEAAKAQHVLVMHQDRKDQESIVNGIVGGLKQVQTTGGEGGLATLAELLKNPDALAVLRAIVAPEQPQASKKKNTAASERMRKWHADRKAAKTAVASPTEE